MYISHMKTGTYRSSNGWEKWVMHAVMLMLNTGWPKTLCNYISTNH
jgi:hypothetical protein